MTLQNLFEHLSKNPTYVVAYFLALPICALLVGLIGGRNDHLAPWKYLYSIIIYFVSIPGIFAVALTVYFFLFQRRDIMQTDLLLQVLPIFSLVLTIFILKKNIKLEYIPGFKTISGLWLLLFVTYALMWLLEKIHIVVFSFLPFQYLIGIFLGIFALLYLGWQRISK